MAKKTKKNDSKAKKAIREKWSIATKCWMDDLDPGFSIRARPKESGDRTPMPFLAVAGAQEGTTQPDAMWVYIDPWRQFADVLAIEACSSSQNLADKRSRFMPTTYALVLRVKREWLEGKIYAHTPRWKKFGTWAKTIGNKTSEADREKMRDFPVRQLVVLYVLEEKVFKKVRHQIFAPHERVCTRESASSPTGSIQSFLKGMNLRALFYPRKKHTD